MCRHPGTGFARLGRIFGSATRFLPQGPGSCQVSSASPPPSGTTQLDAVYFRVSDAAGLALSNIKPTATVTSGGGSILGINNYNSQAPGLYSLDVRMGPKRKTDNVFQIVAGDATYDITITTN